MKRRDIRGGFKQLNNKPSYLGGLLLLNNGMMHRASTQFNTRKAKENGHIYADEPGSP
jgi:hypothetical protein